MKLIASSVKFTHHDRFRYSIEFPEAFKISMRPIDAKLDIPQRSIRRSRWNWESADMDEDPKCESAYRRSDSKLCNFSDK
jgi:hypothetical protein